ncbi:M48 family metallopeptidase [Fervidobacterium sp.]
MINTFVVIFLTVIILKTLWDITLDIMNLRYSTNPNAKIPDVLKDKLSQEDFEKAKKYLKDRVLFGVVRKLTSLIVDLIFLLKVFPYLEKVLSDKGSTIFQAILFFAIYELIDYLVGLPFSIYSIFVIEQKHGFNTTTPKTFLKDQLLGIILTVAIGVPVVAIATLLLVKFQIWWWQLSILFIALMLFFMIIQPLFIAPLFYKFTELDDEELKKKLRVVLDKSGVKVPNIFKMDASKRTKKQNAYLTGIGKSRRLVIFDTILSYNHDEVLSVVAHELGHHVKRHIPKLLVINSLLVAFILCITNILYKFILNTGVFGLTQPYTTFIYAYTFIISIMFFLEPIVNYLSRKMEYEADEYSARLLGTSEPLISSLKRLVKENLSNPNPHPLYKIWHYNHPAPEERIRRLEELRVQNG